MTHATTLERAVSAQKPTLHRGILEPRRALPPFLLAFLSGVLLALTLPPFNAPWLMWVGVVPLLLAIHGQPRSRVLGYSYLTGLIFFSSFWYGVLPWGLPVLLSVCLGLPLFFVVVMGLWVGLAPGVPRGARAWLLALIWAGVEYLATRWLHLPLTFATTQASQPILVQGAALIGPYELSALIVAVNAVVADLIRMGRAIPLRGSLGASSGAILLLAAANLLYGAWELRAANAPRPDAAVDVVMLQPDAESGLYQQRWVNLGEADDFVDVALDLTRALAPSPGQRPTIMIWPEGGNPYYNLRVPWIRKAVAQLAVKRHAYVAMSSLDLSEQGGQFNSLFWVSPEGRLLARYDKQFLVRVAEGAFTPGTDPVLFQAPFGALGPMICAESNFPQFAMALTRRGANVLLVSSSDASFGRSSLPFAHTQMAIMRAIESRRPVLLAANAGPSMVIDPYGRPQRESRFLERTALMGSVVPVSGLSIYHRAGYLLDPIMLALLLLVALQAVVQRRRSAPRRLERGHPASRPGRRWASALGRASALSALACLVAGIVCAGSLTMVNRQSHQPLPVSQAVGDFLRDRLPAPRPLSGFEFRQRGRVTCGSAAVAYLLSAMGKRTAEHDVNALVQVTDRGIDLYSLKRAIERLGLAAWGEQQNYEALRQIPKPIIAHMRDDHYVVVMRADGAAITVFDPAFGRHVRVSRAAFEEAWGGVVLVVRPQPIPASLLGVEELSSPRRRI